MTHPFHSADVDVDAERAKELIDEGDVQLVDVREPYEWDAGRIAGARHVELERLASEAESLDRDRPVLFYCRSGNRSGMAADAFAEGGWDAHNLDGGIEAWAADGRQLEPDGGEVVGPLPPTADGA